MAMKKIVFVDIDGTIIDRSRGLDAPSAKTKEAFKSLKEKGHLVFIASGRSKCLLPTSVKELEPSGYLLANGTYGELDGKVLFSKVMTEDCKETIATFADKVGGCYYLETQEHIYTKDTNLSLHNKFVVSWGESSCYRDEGYNKDLPINIAMLAIPKSDDLVKSVYDELSPYVTITRQGDLYSFDLNIKDTSKGSGISEILAILGIAKEDAYAYGDGYNDLQMFDAVRYGVAMANAVDELKSKAYTITADVLDDGLYTSLINFGLI